MTNHRKIVTVPTDTAATAGGYVCKRCHYPSPMGVGYFYPGRAAAVASANITECRCGYSVDPRGYTIAATTVGDPNPWADVVVIAQVRRVQL